MNRKEAKENVPEGWHRLVDAAYDLLDQYGGSCSQVKEKFGSIRFYCKGLPDAVEDQIMELEHLSFNVCIDCGEITPDKLELDNGFLKLPRCKSHI